MKIVIVFGTRPEVIKMWPVIEAARKCVGPENVKTIFTGQHQELTKPLFKIFEISPDHNFQLMQPNQTLSHSSSVALQKTADVLRTEKPDWVLVQGDTNTAFAAALAAFYEKINVGHVEAGLRTYDLTSPYPEEGNRQLISRIATLHFCPTERNAKDVIREGILKDKVRVTGNTIVDAIELMKMRFLPNVDVKKMFPQIDFTKRLVLITGHRRESFGEGFQNICHAIAKLSDLHPDVTFVYPVHLNPNVREPVNSILGKRKQVLLLDPLNYLEFLALLQRASLVLTDSGGVQEEAPSFQVPVIVMRQHTERTESVDAGYSWLVGTNQEKIIQKATELLKSGKSALPRVPNPYGDGTAAEKIIGLLK